MGSLLLDSRAVVSPCLCPENRFGKLANNELKTTEMNRICGESVGWHRKKPVVPRLVTQGMEASCGEAGGSHPWRYGPQGVLWLGFPDLGNWNEGGTVTFMRCVLSRNSCCQVEYGFTVLCTGLSKRIEKRFNEAKSLCNKGKI